MRQIPALVPAACLIACFVLAKAPQVLAADPPAKPAIQDEDDDDDDDDDDKKGPAGKKPDVPAITREAGSSAWLFSPFSAADWNVEVGVQLGFASRPGRRSTVEGLTGLTYNIVWRDLIFLSSDRGLGINLIDRKGLFNDLDRIKLGFSLSTDDADATGLSRSQARAAGARRNSSAFALGFAEYRIDRWRVWTELAHFLTNGEGNVLSLGGEYTLPLTRKSSTTFATGISFGDGAYMRNNFTVPPLAPASTGRTTYVTPKAGARDLTVSADFEYRADAHWRWNTVVGFTQSLAVSQQGTFVKVRSVPFLTTGIRYRF
jgi:outer membrane scaffolding protein for murein synthesis (MipA/OmpV family)